ncbi:MAG: GntR family transcriptional regulator [Lachnospiraceae bacterium]
MNNSIEEQRRILVDYIKNYIKKNRLHVGDKLPSENSLAEQFAVNRNTVRNVFSMLKAQGYVYAKKGCGYFVAERPKSFSYEYNQNRGFSESILEKEETYENRIINITKRKMTVKEQNLFKTENAENVFIVTTERSVHNRVFAIGKQVLPECYVPEFDKQLQNFHSVNDLLMDKYEYSHPICKKMTIEACIPNKEEIEKLGLESNIPILKQTELFEIEGIGYISFFTVSARGDMFKVEMEF